MFWAPPMKRRSPIPIKCTVHMLRMCKNPDEPDDFLHWLILKKYNDLERKGVEQQMPKVVAIGIQDFEKLRTNGSFYVDKTDFIREWWNNQDEVTLITRPRRFGKTLNMSMMNCFFSSKYAGRGDLFEGLNIWRDESFRALQGTYPVIYLSFADIKQTQFQKAEQCVNQIIEDLYYDFEWMIQDEMFTEGDRRFFSNVKIDMDSGIAAVSIRRLCRWMEKYYGKKVLIFLDEYDTPMQEAYSYGYLDDMSAYFSAFMNSTFKTNPSLERAILTGITRIGNEPVSSNLNNLEVVTTTSEKYATSFGFTEKEVFEALDHQGLGDKKNIVKDWYDGFTFGGVMDIYNPWSITNLLDKGKIGLYWVNSSENSLVGKLIQQGDKGIKTQFETLLAGGTLEVALNEEIVFSQLNKNRNAIWSLLLATGYLKVIHNSLAEESVTDGNPVYTLALTNREVQIMFSNMVRNWFPTDGGLTEFIQAMFAGNSEEMQAYLNNTMKETMSFFDTSRGGKNAPEKFYHGFVLGLLVGKPPEYRLKSNRESGFGRYDVILEPQEIGRPAVILEFKVFNADRGEKTLSDTATNALKQIEEKEYDTELLALGIQADHILKYGLGFRGKKCRIMKA